MEPQRFCTMFACWPHLSNSGNFQCWVAPVKGRTICYSLAYVGGFYVLPALGRVKCYFQPLFAKCLFHTPPSGNFKREIRPLFLKHAHPLI